MEISIVEAVIELTGNESFEVTQDGVVLFEDGSTPPDPADVLAKWEEMKNHYIVNRQAEYPDMGTQLNKIYDDGVTKWKSEMVDPVKAKWPKDNSGPK
mgnify:CR=1 FL=1